MLQSVRFALMGIVELADLEETVEKDEVLRPAANEITAAIRAAYEDKLAGPRPGREVAAVMVAARPVPTPTRKRMATTLARGAEEERLLKVMRATCRLSAVDWAGPLVLPS